MQPLIFHPILKQIRWGGRRLGTHLKKPIGPENDYAESWEICDHGVDQSRVAKGIYQGQTLQELVREHREALLGARARGSQFPLLIKYLDCNDRLSVQVHPHDELARMFNPVENGKTEAWVVMQAEPGSVIYAGLQEGVTADQLARALESGTVESLLHRIEPQAGDCFFIPAGTIHALGEGVLVAEVQQSSDLTFRLYDWGRVDGEGKSRHLHIPQAFRCIDFSGGPVQPVEPVVVEETEGILHEKLVECPYFSLDRLEIRGRMPMIHQGACRVLLGLQGGGVLSGDFGELDLSTGQTILLPAACPPVIVTPKTEEPWRILVAEVA